MFHTTDEFIVQCGVERVERKRRSQRDHWGRMGWNVPTLVSDEPLEMRGGNCPTRQDGRWGSQGRLCPRGKSPWVGWERTWSDAVSIFTSEVENSKGEWGVGTQEEGLALL